MSYPLTRYKGYIYSGMASEEREILEERCPFILNLIDLFSCSAINWVREPELLSKNFIKNPPPEPDYNYGICSSCGREIALNLDEDPKKKRRCSYCKQYDY